MSSDSGYSQPYAAVNPGYVQPETGQQIAAPPQGERFSIAALEGTPFLGVLAGFGRLALDSYAMHDSYARHEIAVAAEPTPMAVAIPAQRVAPETVTTPVAKIAPVVGPEAVPSRPVAVENAKQDEPETPETSETKKTDDEFLDELEALWDGIIPEPAIKYTPEVPAPAETEDESEIVPTAEEAVISCAPVVAPVETLVEAPIEPEHVPVPVAAIRPAPVIVRPNIIRPETVAPAIIAPETFTPEILAAEIIQPEIVAPVVAAPEVAPVVPEAPETPPPLPPAIMEPVVAPAIVPRVSPAQRRMQARPVQEVQRERAEGLELITKQLSAYRDRFETVAQPDQEAWLAIQSALARTPCVFTETPDSSGAFATIKGTWTFERDQIQPVDAGGGVVTEQLSVSTRRIVHRDSEAYKAYKALSDPRSARNLASMYSETGLLGVIPVKVSSLPFARPVFPQRALALAAGSELARGHMLEASLTARETGETERRLVKRVRVDPPIESPLLSDEAPAVALDFLERSYDGVDEASVEQYIDDRHTEFMEDNRPAGTALSWLEGFLRTALPLGGTDTDADI